MGREIQAAFRKAMEEKFQTTENLNKAFGLAYWSNSIHNWEDFPDMRGCINGGLASEFSAFQRKMAADYLMWQADLIREYKREDQFITHNLDLNGRNSGPISRRTAIPTGCSRTLTIMRQQSADPCRYGYLPSDTGRSDRSRDGLWRRFGPKSQRQRISCSGMSGTGF